MKFMVIVKATKESEAGVMPSTEHADGNGQLQRRAGEGRRACWPAKGCTRARRARGCGSPARSRTVVDGPFTETKELIAGFWLLQVRSKEEAIEWVKRCPNPMRGSVGDRNPSGVRRRRFRRGPARPSCARRKSACGAGRREESASRLAARLAKMVGSVAVTATDPHRARSRPCGAWSRRSSSPG